jgi:hypothetical protein
MVALWLRSQHGFISPSALSPYDCDDPIDPMETDARAGEVQGRVARDVGEAVRNTQPETELLPEAKKVRG